jgi:hypothetical protein
MLRLPLIMFFALLAGVLGAGAQPGATHGGTAGPSLNTKPIMVRGCLRNAAGSYVLTQDHGQKVFTLIGKANQLHPHIGQVVEITGPPLSLPGASNRNPTSSANTSRQSATALEVQDLTIVSDHCDSSQGAMNSGGAVTHTTIAGVPHNPAPSSEDIPNSATILPLLGMVGLGSLAASLIMRR